MNLTSLRLGLGCLLVTMVGCAGEPAEETAQSTEQEITAEDILCTFFQCESGPSSSSRWMKLGQAEVDGLFDHDRIDVGVNARFSKIQLRIKDGGVKIHDFEVRFRDGSYFAPDFVQTFGEDDVSDTAYFPGGAKRIDSITIEHSKMLFGTGSTVEVWAKR